MRFPRYDNYRYSGVEWQGQVPSHWKEQRLKTLVEIKKRIVGFEGHDVLSITQNGIRVRDVESNDGQVAENYSHYQLVEVGDFAMNHMDLLTGWIDISKQVGVTSPDYRVFSKRSSVEAEPRYILRILQYAYSGRIFYSLGQGASHLGRWRLPTESFENFYIPMPPLNEQEAIATVLGRETTKIDALVGAQKQLIEHLREKRRAIISHAVTKGIDPANPMKASGVEWLGDMPAHWIPIQLGRLCRQVSDGPHFSPSYVEEGVPFLSARNVQVDGWSLEDVKYITEQDCQEFNRRIIPEVGDVLYTKGGTTGIARAVDLNFAFQVWVHVAVLKLRRKMVIPEYLAYALNGASCYEQSQLYTRGATNQDLGLTRMTKIWLGLPPIPEQELIVRALDERIQQIDELTTEAQSAIDLLRERRSALIFAAITGKIDIRSAADKSSHSQFDRRRLRMIVGATIFEALANKTNSGRTKPHKLVYLTQIHGNVPELHGYYRREAAGPLDRELVDEMEAALQAEGHVLVEQPGGTGSQVKYKVFGRPGAYRAELETALGPRVLVLDKLIKDLGDLDTKHVEAIATLYAVWNDALLDGQNPVDDAVVSGVLNDWHPEKPEKFSARELHTWLGWMRRHELVPKGMGSKTSTGRLFV